MGDGGNESVAVTAGIWGFLVLFALAIACWLLFRSMNNHLRGVRWREEDREAALQEQQAQVIPPRPVTPPATGTDGTAAPPGV
ncbi:hypothetical protein [Rudaeicoccus suwonensis]|uniref:Uncharacterized protein n=1 Tax=Rudaeicoccus suwonensis TaxID=657409 RepID=A0A561E8I2_9MICO|nr:hypothetical protein [Rudaeicoccus suwonensis]TWE11870.1 hypothetical protein BKA23_0663 [Rudaeicoccus suwonensis]